MNFSLPLRSFEENIAGVKNLLDFVISCENDTQMIFCSSIASVTGKQDRISEAVSTSPKDASKLGYSRSKWVAEAVCSAAAMQLEMTGRIKVLRIGQLTGDTQNGIWNMSEAWPLMLSTVNVVGCLPRLNEKLGWMPMDKAAKAVVELAFTGLRDDDCLVYHVCNNLLSPFWSEMLTWIARARREKFEVVEPEIWLEKLENLQQHPAKSLLWLWREAFVTAGKAQPEQEFQTKRAEGASRTMKFLRPVDEWTVEKIWRWIDKESREKEEKVAERRF